MADTGPNEDIEAARKKALFSVNAIFERYQAPDASMPMWASRRHADQRRPCRWQLIAAKNEYQGFDSYVMLNAKVLDASLGPTYQKHAGGRHGEPLIPGPAALATSTTSLYMDSTFSNMNGVVHGGVYGIIFDMLTTIALGPLAYPGFWDYLGGVSRSLNISFLRPCPLRSTVVVHAHVYHVGRNMAMIKGWMTSEDGKVVYATCDHHKVAMATPEKHLAFRVPWDAQWEKKSAAGTDPKL